MEKLQEILKYQFRNPKLLLQALTHGSTTGNAHRNYERLEFLGDRVLGLTMAHLLYNIFPNDREGDLAQRHVKLVCAATVADVVKKLHIDDYIIAKDRETAQSINVLCDVGEAIIGAIYIDSDIEQAIAFVERNWRGLIDRHSSSEKDFKTRLQEKFQAAKLPFPVYEITAKDGSEHEPVFTIRVSSSDNLFGEGKGKNKKEAEQKAAADLLNKMEKKGL